MRNTTPTATDERNKVLRTPTLKDAVRIQVSKTHILEGESGDAEYCPIALAIKDSRLFRGRPRVDADEIDIEYETCNVCFESAPSLAQIVNLYDETGEMPEGTLVLEGNTARFEEA